MNWKKLVFLFFGLLVACQQVTVPLTEPPPPLSQPVPTAISPTPESEPMAELVDLHGNGRWRASDSVDWDIANLGLSLRVNNQVLTESQSKAVIKYPDGLQVYVAPKTLFTVTDLSQAGNQKLQTTIQLLIGELFVSHTGEQGSQIRIETEAGIAGVRGTMLSVKVTISGRVVVTCLEGVCTLENEHGQIILEAGKQAEFLNSTVPPVFLGLMADYQLNEWFSNQPESLRTALTSGVISKLPPGCTLEASLSCQIELTCDPNSGIGCPLSEGCDRASGQGCELAGGCNPVSGQGCALLPGCDPASGQGCQLPTGCNPANNHGCAQALNCDPFSGIGCQPAADCDQQTGMSCELPTGCNPVTGQNCGCETLGCFGQSILGTSPNTELPIPNLATAMPITIPPVDVPKIPDIPDAPEIPDLPFP